MAQLFLFREGRRDSVIMNAQAKTLTDGDLRTLASTLAALPPPPPPAEAPDAARMARGAALVRARNCASCHGRDFSGGSNVPRLAHQREDYLVKALRDYRAGARIGYGNAVMPETVAGLQDAEIADLAHYLAHSR